MTSISLRLYESLLHSLDKNADKLHVSRTSYIRKAIREYNAKIQAENRRKKLMEASHLVCKNSIRINKEFSKIENDPEA